MLTTKQTFVVVMCLGMMFFFGCSTLDTAESKINQEKYKEAIPLYEDYLEKHPDEIVPRTKLGFAYLKTGRLDEAILEFKQVLKSRPGEPFSILYLGQVYLNKKEFDNAIETWETARDKNLPEVEKEIRRQKANLMITKSQYLAEEALTKEGQIETVEPDADTIAASYFEDLSSDKSLRPFQKGLGAMLTSDLSKIKSLKVVERMQLQALLQEMGLGKTGILDSRTAPRAGRLLGAETLLVGNIVGSIDTAAVLTSTSKEQIVGSTSIRVEKEEFYKLPILIVRDVAKLLNIELTAEENQEIGIPHTTNYKAFIYYGKAIDAVDEGDYKKAKDLFASALREDPKFDLAKSGFDFCSDVMINAEVRLAPTVLLNRMLQDNVNRVGRFRP